MPPEIYLFGLKREPREEAEALIARYGMDCQL
jgi:hypothetical protein